MHPRPSHARRKGRLTAFAAALALVIALPASSLGVDGYNTDSAAYVAFTAAVPRGAKIIPLVNSGEQVFGTTFEGIPDGIGAVPVDDDHVDLYVTHEQSHVPFSNFADFIDSSVTRVRLNVESKSIVDMDVALSPAEGFIRFCSAFMAGPEHGFADYTFLLNEESDDNLEVPAGTVYDSDPSMAPLREAGYSVWLNTSDWTEFDVIPGLGRHNHENTVVVPGGWDDFAALSGDDTFNAPSSQLYLYTAADADAFKSDDGQLWAFRVTDTNGAAAGGGVDPADPQNNANDYLEITLGATWSGEFIEVPSDVARGDLADQHPQAGLESWSNANNVFQFVRVEDIAYDPDDPRVVYFTDTGTTRLIESATTGRLFRGGTGTGTDSNGRVFRMVLNANDPTVVDELSILVDAGSIGMRNPDNLAVGSKSIMVQEDSANNNRVWQYKFKKDSWTHVASATQVATAETSGIVDVSQWFGGGWWALDVQSHVNQTSTTGRPFTWTGPPGPAVGHQYDKRREDGQLLLMHIPGS